MSCRQADTHATRTQRFQQRTQSRRARLCDPLCPSDVSLCALVAVFISVRDSCHLPRLERFEKLPRLLDVELWVDRLDAEEEPVAAREREAWNGEDRGGRLRQPGQR